MLLDKVMGKSIEPEMALPKFERVSPAAPVPDLASASIALVTDGGLVPKGNPDKLEPRLATKFGSYSIKDLNALTSGDYEGNHLGYDTAYVDQDPNRLLPVDVMRDLEKEEIIGNLHETFYTLAGVATILENASKLGQGIAEKLKAAGVTAVILTST
jgi:glycine reductase